MNEQCKATCRVPAAFGGGPGQVICALPMTHQGALHFDRDLRLWWLPALPDESPSEDLPAAVRLNEDIPAALQREWLR